LRRAPAEFPRFNASLTADGETLILKHFVHIGIAVDTPHGLMVPVIRDADRKGLWQIASEIADLAGRAQAAQDRPRRDGRRLDVDLQSRRHRRHRLHPDRQSAGSGDPRASPAPKLWICLTITVSSTVPMGRRWPILAG
jgi:hypothetical protein